MLTDVLVVGSGGREHALAWKLAQNPRVKKVYTAPGNGGTPNNVPIDISDIDGLAGFAQKNGCFTIVGPEAPLAAGIVDRFCELGLGIFGPTQAAARLESSKIWAKDFMKKNGIPTARYETFDDADAALEYAQSAEYDVVVKADGLAAGKGVIVCSGAGEAADAIKSMLVGGDFGDAGRQIVIEERLEGTEVSFISLSDGTAAVPMASSQDHKRIHDGDMGPNTGGMGAYSPTPVINEEMAEMIQRDIVEKTVTSMRVQGSPVRGFLYAGMMISGGRPYVLEYNVRMGDPECQPVLARMESDLFAYAEACAKGSLGLMPPISWSPQSAACVVLASRGYPEKYPKGEVITGLDSVSGAHIFHAGTKSENGAILSDGGRVLGVTALGDTLADAVSRAYAEAGKISWPSKYCRTDIGKKAL